MAFSGSWTRARYTNYIAVVVVAAVVLIYKLIHYNTAVSRCKGILRLVFTVKVFDHLTNSII